MDIGKRGIYQDPETVRKQLECERRKERLLQVRGESKNLAKKIRTKVAAEKEKHIKDLEAIKNKELDCWRENVLTQKYQDYRSAIFQVGAAHRAAAEEKKNKSKQNLQNNCKPSVSVKKTGREFETKHKIAESKSKINQQKYKESSPSVKKTGREFETHKLAESKSKEAYCPQVSHNEGKHDKKEVVNKGNRPCSFSEQIATKRKREGCHCCKHVCFCQLDDKKGNESFKDHDSDISSESVVSSDIEIIDNKKNAHQFKNRYANRPLEKTPIVLDIDVENCENVSISDFDIDDTHVQNNRKFTRVVRLTPKTNVHTQIVVNKKATKSCPLSEKDETSSNQKSSTTATSTSTARSSISAKTSSSTQSSANECKTPPKSRKRISTISDYLKNKQQTQRPCGIANLNKPPKCTEYLREVQKDEAGQKPREPNSPMTVPSETDCNLSQVNKDPVLNSRGAATAQKTIQQKSNVFLRTNCTSKKQAPQGAPRKELNNLYKVKESAMPRGYSTTNSKFKPNDLPSKDFSSQARQSAASIKAKSRNLASPIPSKSYDTVQYFDYNNKFEKRYDQPENIIHQEVQNKNEPNAMQLAQIEKENKILRLQNCHKKRETAIERGQKALEREQLRRECNDFTEKLDSLMKQYPRLLSKDDDFVEDVQISQKVTDKQTKMNRAVEDILLKPAIITCPYVNNTSDFSMQHKPLNLANTTHKYVSSDTSASCCSALLDLVNDQGKEIEKCLTVEKDDPQKIEQLKALMGRVEKLRTALLDELRKKGQFQDKSVQNTGTLSSQQQSTKSKNENLHNAKWSDGKLGKPCTSKEPLEIIIKVQSDHIVDVKQNIPKGNKNVSVTAKNTHAPFTITEQPVAYRQDSHDSNSTAYRSLPSHLSNQNGQNLASLAKDNNSLDSIHPLVEHYVQRLLGMNRASVRGLCVSTSDVETPNSSVINISSNKAAKIMTEERLKRVEKFIAENRSLINQLECSVAAQKNLNPEETLKLFDEIWKSRFEKSSDKSKNEKKSSRVANSIGSSAKRRINKRDGNPNVNMDEISSTAPSTDYSIKKPDKVLDSKKPKRIVEMQNDTKPKTSPKEAENRPKLLQSQSEICPQEAQIERYAELTENCTQRIKELTELITKVREEKKKLLEVTLSSVSDTGRNSTEYLELPVTQKSELTTSQCKCIDGKGRNNCECSSSSNDSKMLDTQLVNEIIAAEGRGELPSVSTNPLEFSKHRHISTSLDSGIAISRPVTALDHNQENDPTSFSSSVKSPTGGLQKKARPPPTLKRFSPQMSDGDNAHELSTIAEVETPGASRLNSSVQGNQKDKCLTDNSHSKRQTCEKLIIRSEKSCTPQSFPTFEQYIKEINVELSSLNEEQSMRLQFEFKEFLSAIKAARQKGLEVEEFPDLSGYVDNHSVSGLPNSTKEENIADVISQMRQMQQDVNNFPNRHEYLEKIKSNTIELLDTESIDNISENISSHAHSDTCSESLNIEEELRRRNILKSSFRRTEIDNNKKKFAESTRHEHAHGGEFDKDLFTAESGIEKLSTSNSIPSSLEHQKKVLGLSRYKRNSSDATSSSGTIPTPGKGQELNSTCNSKPETSYLGKPLNLREFLTKELQKHTNSSISSTTCTDDSVRNFFLRSILDTLTPETNCHGSHAATGQTLDRQKTSTPVVSTHSSSYSAGSPSHLFSGESGLSSVHCQQEDISTSKRNRTAKSNAKKSK